MLLVSFPQMHNNIHKHQPHAKNQHNPKHRHRPPDEDPPTNTVANKPFRPHCFCQIPALPQFVHTFRQIPKLAQTGVVPELVKQRPVTLHLLLSDGEEALVRKVAV